MNILRRVWGWLHKPSARDVWKSAFERLQIEEETNGRGKEYQRIWHEEVCPAYRQLVDETPPPLRHPLADKILFDMDRPINERKYFRIKR